MVDHDHEDDVGPNLKRNPNEWSMVVIHDHDNNDEDYSVFPPINHENLSLSFSNDVTPSSSSSSFSSSCSFSTSVSDTWSLSSPSDSQVRKGSDFSGWVSLGLQILRSKVLATISSFRNNTRAIWSIGVPAVTMIVLMMMMMCKKNRRRKSLSPNETRLMNIIKEKDTRIARLLHQIAQMNEILIARHKALAAKVME